MPNVSKGNETDKRAKGRTERTPERKRWYGIYCRAERTDGQNITRTLMVRNERTENRSEDGTMEHPGQDSNGNGEYSGIVTGL